MASKALQTVLITGAEGALGRRVVRKFLDAGIRVIGTHLAPPPAELPAGERLTWARIDIADSRAVREGIAALRASHGEIDGIVHCAGGFRFAKVEEATDADLDFLINVNLKSAFLLLRELIPPMKKQNFGRVVLISSRATLNAPAGMSAYAATKGGLNALVSSLSEEVRAFDINVNAVMPTVIDTPANRKDMPSADFASWVTPDELGAFILGLMQPVGKPINGALIPVAGRL